MQTEKGTFEVIPMSNVVAKFEGESKEHIESCVGFGYNVLNSSYINPADIAVNYPILNVKDENFKKLINTISSKTTDEIHQSGSTLVDMLENLSAQLSVGAKTLLFSGQISAEFSKSDKSTSEYTYSKHICTCIREREYLSEGDEFKQFIHPAFLKDLEGPDKLSAKKLFERYGTHIITDICRGGRLDVNFSYRRDFNESTMKIDVNAEAAYKAFTTKASSQYDTTTKQVIDKSDIRVKSVGGVVQKLFSPDNFKEVFESWSASLDNKENWEICGIANNLNALLPIWELCSDNQRKKELEDEFMSEFSAVESELANWQTYVTDVVLVSAPDDGAAQRQCPEGYKLVHIDLNKGAKGNFIYLCYKVGAKQSAITCMFCESSRNGRGAETRNVDHLGHNASFTRIDSDLNKGSGGNFLYLNYSKSQVYPPIKRVCVVEGNDRGDEDWKFVYWQNTQEKADCNITVKGAFIYIIVEQHAED